MRLPRWLRRRPKPKFDPIVTPFIDPEPLGDEIIRHLYATMDSMPASERRGARWVMSTEWFNEVRKAAMDRTGYLPPMRLGSADYLLGIPIEVRDDGGVPHLEAIDSQAGHG